MSKKNFSNSFGSVENIIRNSANKSNELSSKIAQFIDITLIEENKENFFNMENDAQFKALVESIKSYGVMSPITVLKLSDPTSYKLISGHRRLRATKIAGLEKIPCFFLSLDSKADELLALIDGNLTTRELKPSEITQAIKIIEENINNNPSFSGRKRDHIGALLGLSGIQVQRYKALESLIPELKSLVDNDKIGISSVTPLATLKKEEQEQAYTEISNLEKNLGIKATREDVNNIKKTISKPKIQTKNLLHINFSYEKNIKTDDDIENVFCSMLLQSIIKKINDNEEKNIINKLISYYETHFKALPELEEIKKYISKL